MTLSLDDMDVICIIPARGGSKGIPRKNVRLLAGKPLLAHSIEAARGTQSISRVIVSTDDDEIAHVARQYRAEVIRRPAELSGDTASSESALLHALDHLRSEEDYEPGLVVFLQATSPLRKPDDIQNAVEKLRREQADSLFSSVPVHGFIWRATADRLGPISYDPIRRPTRQELQETFLEENGSIYIFKPWVIRAHSSRLGGNVAAYEMDPLDSFQVDEPADLDFVERLLVLPSPMVKQPSLAAVSLLVLDFDGVLTDNRVAVMEDGREGVWCHRGDSLGIARLKRSGVEVVVLSTETNQVVSARCRKLGIECNQGLDDKLAVLEGMVAGRSLNRDQIAYVGNDVNDLQCLRWVGAPIIVADAEPELQRESALMTSRKGGHGAVREVANWILTAREESRDEQPIEDVG